MGYYTEIAKLDCVVHMLRTECMIVSDGIGKRYFDAKRQSIQLFKLTEFC